MRPSRDALDRPAWIGTPSRKGPEPFGKPRPLAKVRPGWSPEQARAFDHRHFKEVVKAWNLAKRAAAHAGWAPKGDPPTEEESAANAALKDVVDARDAWLMTTKDERWPRADGTERPLPDPPMEAPPEVEIEHCGKWTEGCLVTIFDRDGGCLCGCRLCLSEDPEREFDEDEPRKRG